METRTRTQYYRRRSTRVKCVVAIVVVIALIAIVVTVVAVTVSNANRREENTGTVPPSNRPTTAVEADLSTEPALTTFPAQSKTKNVTLSFRAFTSDRLEIVLNVTFQYHIGPERFRQLYAIYGSEYELTLEASAVDELKVVATQFSVREYTADDQSNVERALSLGIRQRLEGTCCKPSCETLPEGCVAGCVPPSQCTDQQRGFVDAVIFWSFAVETPRFPGR